MSISNWKGKGELIEENCRCDERMDRAEGNCRGGVVCALKIRELTLDIIYLTWMLAWRRNWWTVVTARFARAEFVVTTVIVCAS